MKKTYGVISTDLRTWIMDATRHLAPDLKEATNFGDPADADLGAPKPFLSTEPGTTPL